MPPVSSNEMIEGLLQPFQPVIDRDYHKYRNHVYRVYLNCLMMDREKSHEEKYAIAAVYHDIAIWTDQTIDYLHPSIHQARLYLQHSGKQDWNEEITAMIYWHHKTSAYQGAFAATAETFRKADWIDVSLGILHYHADPKKIRLQQKAFPNLGFHLFLLKRILTNFLRHPLHPLPMFTR